MNAIRLSLSYLFSKPVAVMNLLFEVFAPAPDTDINVIVPVALFESGTKDTILSPDAVIFNQNSFPDDELPAGDTSAIPVCVLFIIVILLVHLK